MNYLQEGLHSAAMVIVRISVGGSSPGEETNWPSKVVHPSGVDKLVATLLSVAKAQQRWRGDNDRRHNAGSLKCGEFNLSFPLAYIYICIWLLDFFDIYLTS